ncbi:MAG: small basic protein [Planctomycetes bacterium]|nr:small basic protein [Planctomycetota bacterium]
MTIHKSLRVKSTMTRARNVWKRVERVIKLEEDGKFADGASIFGLPKVKTRLKVKAVKAAKKEAAPAAEGAAATAAPAGKAGAKAAAPAAAAGAKPAAKPAAKGGK